MLVHSSAAPNCTLLIVECSSFVRLHVSLAGFGLLIERLRSVDGAVWMGRVSQSFNTKVLTLGPD